MDHWLDQINILVWRTPQLLLPSKYAVGTMTPIISNQHELYRLARMGIVDPRYLENTNEGILNILGSQNMGLDEKEILIHHSYFLILATKTGLPQNVWILFSKCKKIKFIPWIKFGYCKAFQNSYCYSNF